MRPIKATGLAIGLGMVDCMIARQPRVSMSHKKFRLRGFPARAEDGGRPPFTFAHASQLRIMNTGGLILRQVKYWSNGWILMWRLACDCSTSLLPCLDKALACLLLRSRLQLHPPYNEQQHHLTASAKMHADCLPGASVTVRVDGMPLTEYATENSDMSATTFIEAIAGAEFDVTLSWSDHFAYRDPADRIRFCVYVDGEWVRTPILSTRRGLPCECTVVGPQDTRNGVTTFKRLIFAEHASSRWQTLSYR